MLEQSLHQVYYKFKLNFYQNIFKRFETREASLTAIETFCLEVIYGLNHPTVKELSQFIHISQPNAAYKVASLVKKGYIRKVRSQEDKREYYLEVTDKYNEFYGINYEFLKLVAHRIENEFPKEDIQKLDQMLIIISERLMPEVTNQLSNHNITGDSPI